METVAGALETPTDGLYFLLPHRMITWSRSVAQDETKETGDPKRAEPLGPDVTTSAELVHRIQAGDDRALDVLITRYRPGLRRWAAGRLPGWARDLVDTEDMVQEALVGTVRNIQKFEPRATGAFGAYLRRALTNRIRDEIRKAQTRPQRVEIQENHPDDGDSPLENAIGREAMHRYEKALERLSDEERELVVGRIEMGLSYKEVAAAANKPSADAARMAVARALLRVAKEMGHE
jgi:RNA polymerase sigma factor (sigma-70 family)